MAATRSIFLTIRHGGEYLFSGVKNVSGFKVRPMRAGEEAQYLELYNFVFPERMTREYWHWRNVSGPAGRSMIETAWERERLIGAYGLLPLKMRRGGEQIIGALSDAAFTHPEYRYRGVFSALGKSLYIRAREAGIGLVYGFPTEHSRHGFRGGLGWEYVGRYRDLACWSRPARAGVASPADIRRVEEAGDDFDRLWAQISSGALRSCTVAARDRRYADWLFFGRPESLQLVFMARGEGGPTGYMAVRPGVEAGESYADLVDIAAGDVRSFRDLLWHAAEFFTDTACLRLRLPEGSPFYSAARSMGFKETGPVYYFGCREADGKGCGPGWYYTMADGG